jgi:acyl-coenzyme A thioesterase PaaI-like protein
MRGEIEKKPMAKDGMTQPDTPPSLTETCLRRHPECFACGPANGHGLGLQFHLQADGAVEALFDCDGVFAGYPGMMHGGIICLLLDGAMTNCLFASGIVAVTVDLQVRFRSPVVVRSPASVRAWREPGTPPVHRLSAQVMQDGRVRATGTGRFFEQQTRSWFAS